MGVVLFVNIIETPRFLLKVIYGPFDSPSLRKKNNKQRVKLLHYILQSIICLYLVLKRYCKKSFYESATDGELNLGYAHKKSAFDWNNVALLYNVATFTSKII